MNSARSLGSKWSQKLALSTMFSVVVFVSKILMPTPIDKMFLVVQTIFLVLGSLLMEPLGATFVSTIGGFLTALWRAPMAGFTIGFALMYGLLIDSFISLFKVKASEGNIRSSKLIFTSALATAIVGLTSYYVTVYVFEMLPRNPIMEIGILVAGIANGVVGGYLAALVWERLR